MIIGLNGKKRSGKDTVYGMIESLVGDQFEVQRVGFADALKEAACRLLNIELDTLEKYKALEDIAEIKISGKGTYAPHGMEELDVAIHHHTGVSVRNFLQRLGTEVGRDMFGENFWISQALPPTYNHVGKIVVVTDCRFENEVAWIKYHFKGMIWKVERPGLSEDDGHVSEANIDLDFIDLTINNNAGLDALRLQVENVLYHRVISRGSMEKF